MHESPASTAKTRPSPTQRATRTSQSVRPKLALAVQEASRPNRRPWSPSWRVRERRRLVRRFGEGVEGGRGRERETEELRREPRRGWRKGRRAANVKPFSERLQNVTTGNAPDPRRPSHPPSPQATHKTAPTTTAPAPPLSPSPSPSYPCSSIPSNTPHTPLQPHRPASPPQP